MILGIFTKNYKAAQTMTMPVTFLAMIPMFVTMFTDFDTLPMVVKVLVSRHTVLAPHDRHALPDVRRLRRWCIAGIAYTAAVALLTMFIAVTLFKKDILLTGKVIQPDKKSKIPLVALLSDHLKEAQEVKPLTHSFFINNNERRLELTAWKSEEARGERSPPSASCPRPSAS